MTARLYTFGGLRLETDGRAVTGAPAQRRRLALLALLAAAGRRGLTRDKLIGLLWPEQSEPRARHLLSESMYVLRQALGDDAFVTVADELRVNEEVVWSDVAAFETAFAAERFDTAVELYRGPFLDGFYLKDAQPFDEWIEGERQRFARAYGRALEALALAAHGEGHATRAVEWWQRLAAHEPFSSRVALSYMDALVAAGDRARAVQHAHAHVARLRAELGVEPDPAVARFAERVRAASASVGSASDSELQPGTVVSEFEIVRVVGEGSVARVYLAREIPLKRMVALKVLLPQLAEIETLRLRFEREAQAAARIQHPNVVTAFRFGRLEGGTPYMVLPYLEGGSLEDRLAASGALPGAEALRYVGEIAAALAAAHRIGIVHRDVRPANVLFDRATSRALLTDFGVAAVIDASLETLRLTKPGEVIGDMRYASPEQLQAEPVTERADVYSLGIVAFEMLTGRLPFDATTDADLMVAHATAAPRRISEFVAGLDPKSEALLQRCLSKRPEQRPFAEELARAFMASR